ncbi:MAG: hypothetical protein IKG27_02690 [Bacilli bacterium]|nr:hypothetical protein [Bacilli bacterium]
MKRNILKVLGISFLIFVFLSWIVPVGTYSGGKLSTTGISPVGLGDLINTPVNAVLTFALYAVIFAVIGGLYGVMEKTGALEKLTDKWVNRFDGSETKFLVITMVLFVVLSSVTGLVIPLFVLVPLFAAALFKMNYDKVTVLAATVGSLLLGTIVSTLGFNVTGYTKNILSLDMTNQIWTKLILFVLLTVLFVFTVVNSAKKKASKAMEVKEVKKEIKAKVEPKKTKPNVSKTTKKTTKKPARKTTTKALAVTKPIKKVNDNKMVSTRALSIILTLMFIVAILGMYNWYYSFNIDVFSKMHEAVMGVKIKGFAIFENLFGGISQFGYWGNVEFIGLMIFTSMVIAFVYKLNINEYVESFIAGMKKMMPTAIYAALASVILAVLYQSLQSGAGTLVDSINGKLYELNDGFNPIITGISALFSGFFFNDLYYLLYDISKFVTSFDSASLSIAGLLIQSVYGVAMMIFPTSVILIAGLSYFDVSYGKWMKYIWRFVLIAFLLVLLACGILTLL